MSLILRNDTSIASLRTMRPLHEPNALVPQKLIQPQIHDTIRNSPPPPSVTLTLSPKAMALQSATTQGTNSSSLIDTTLATDDYTSLGAKAMKSVNNLKASQSMQNASTVLQQANTSSAQELMRFLK